jgi:hypothetical protein
VNNVDQLFGSSENNHLGAVIDSTLAMFRGGSRGGDGVACPHQPNGQKNVANGTTLEGIFNPTSIW